MSSRPVRRGKGRPGKRRSHHDDRRHKGRRPRGNHGRRGAKVAGRHRADHAPARRRQRQATITLGDAERERDGRAAVQRPARPAGPPWRKGQGAPPAQQRPVVAVKLPDAAAKSALYGVSFIDALNGWIVGEKGLCLRTADGGNQWTVLDAGSQATLRAVQFYADGTGWACGDGDPSAPPPRRLDRARRLRPPLRTATLLRTTDGGTTWTTAWLPTNFDAASLPGVPRPCSSAPAAAPITPTET